MSEDELASSVTTKGGNPEAGAVLNIALGTWLLGCVTVTLIVLNNQILGYQKHAEDVKFGAHTDAVFFEPVDHAAVARACGLTGIRVERADAIAAALDEALANDHTTLIDVLCDPDAHPPITGFEE